MDILKETASPALVTVGLHSERSDRETFLHDIREGLRQTPKTLSSKYFYDRTGSELFRQIMELPEYYLTRCELDIFHTQKKEMVRHLRHPGFFHLVDLGAGDGLKTKILLRQLMAEGVEFAYLPVDISADALRSLSLELQAEVPEMPVQAVAGDYQAALDWLQRHKAGPKTLLFLGSNIGNFNSGQSTDFLRSIRQRLQPGDKLLIGFDLQKDPRVIRAAYDDAAGVTAAFNLNLLHRINAEFGANFDVSRFRHFAEYDPLAGAMRSFLISTTDQEVWVEAAQEAFSFQAWEALHTENSYKYTFVQIETMARESGFSIQTSFTGEEKYFADVLFVVP
jgi:L-histidine N-alpha-methyltransferase